MEEDSQGDGDAGAAGDGDRDGSNMNNVGDPLDIVPVRQVAESNCGSCGDDASCFETMDASFACICAEGFEGDGQDCTDIDECAGSTDGCDDNAACTNTVGGFTCECNAGYAGDGTQCEDVDDCADNPCDDDGDAAGACTDLLGDYACICSAGYVFTDGGCMEIDECADADNPCDDDGDAAGACTDMVDDYGCTCSAGYVFTDGGCVEIDECADADNPCDDDGDASGACTDLLGDYACTCSAGYDFTDGGCIEVDECALGDNPCDDNGDAGGACTDLLGDYACTCSAGYDFTDGGCIEVDECALGDNPCDDNGDAGGACTDLIDDYACTCSQGYLAGEGSCWEDIDECTLGDNPCDAQGDAGGVCTDAVVGNTCECSAGFTQRAGAMTTCVMGGEVTIAGGAGRIAGTEVTLHVDPPGNLLTNPGGEVGNGLDGWTVIANGGSGYAQAGGGLFGARLLKTSYAWDRRSQVVDLIAAGFTAEELDAAPRVNVGEFVAGGWPNYADQHYFHAELRATAAGAAIASVGAGSYAAPQTLSGGWETVDLVLENYGAGARFLYIEDGGKDVEFWNGRYGPTFDQAGAQIGDFEMRISNDGENFGDWMPLVRELVHSLDSDEAGLHTVYVEVRRNGGEPALLTDSVLLDYCAGNPCGGTEVCIGESVSYRCECAPGTLLQGGECSTCDGNPGICDANATCASNRCACDAGYIGDGLSCAALAPGEVGRFGRTVTSPSVLLHLAEPGNLLINGGQETGDFTGWTITANGGDGWLADGGGLFGTYTAAGSYTLGSRYQSIDLVAAGYDAATLDAEPVVTVREWHRGFANVADFYRLNVQLRNGAQQAFESYDTGTLTCAAPWQEEGAQLSGYGPGLRHIYFEDHVEDTEFWAGHYGPRLDGAMVTLEHDLQVRLSNDAGASWSEWRAFSTVTDWTLPANVGAHTVTVEFRREDSTSLGTAMLELTLE